MNGVPAVFLDRDGILNHAVTDSVSGFAESPLTLADVQLVEGAGREIARLRAADWFVVCITNQPAAAKGTIDLGLLGEIHQRVLALLAAEGGQLDGERVCWHHPDGTVPALSGSCDCRKPKPGMLIDAATEYGIDLSRSWMIGDTDTDVQAGSAAGVRTVLVTTKETAHKRSGRIGADVVVATFTEAVTAVLAHRVVGDVGSR